MQRSDPRDWLLARYDSAVAVWDPATGDLPLLELDPDTDTTFEHAVLLAAATVAGAIVLSAVSGLLGFLLGLFVAG